MIWQIWKNKLKCEMIWKIWKKPKLKCEKIWKIRNKPKFNSDKIWKIQKKIVKWYGKYGRNQSWRVKRLEKRQVEEWNDMENMEDFCVSHNYTERPSSSSSSSSIPPSHHPPPPPPSIHCFSFHCIVLVLNFHSFLFLKQVQVMCFLSVIG